MKIVMDRNTFKEALGSVALAQGSGQNNEWQRGIRFEICADNKLSLMASDTKVSIAANIPIISSEGDGAFLVDGDCISALVEKYIESQIEISVEENSVDVSCGKDAGQYELMRVEDFCKLEVDDTWENWFSIPSEIFALADSRVRFAAASSDNVQAKTSGVFFRIEKNIVEIVATDGKKLALFTVPVDESIPDMTMLLPAETLNRLYKASKARGITEEIKVNIQADKVYLVANDFMMSANLVGRDYVKYDRIIPKEDAFISNLIFDRKELTRKVEIAEIANRFSADSTNKNYIGIKATDEGWGQGYCSIINANNLSNKQTNQIPFSQESGDLPKDFCMWVDPSIVVQVLKNFDSDEISFSIVSSVKPFRVRAKDGDNAYFALIMPQAAVKDGE